MFVMVTRYIRTKERMNVADEQTENITPSLTLLGGKSIKTA